MRKLAYLFSCANSGSTLLTRVLARHRQIATVGELKATPKSIGDFDSYLCSCGTLLRDCPFWQEVQGVCQKNGLNLELQNFDTDFVGSGRLSNKLIRTPVRGPVLESMRYTMLHGWPGARHQFERVLRHNRIMIEAICQIQGKPLFLDGSKDPIRLKHFYDSKQFDLKAIHLVRDGRAVLASYKKRDADVENNLRLWEKKAIECERVKRLLPKEAVMTLRYEDFCRDPAAVVRRVLAFLELEEDDAVMSEDGSDDQHIIGHNSRLKKIGQIEERTEWHQLLESAELAHFHQVGQPINSLYDYE